jgi:hypothetical protein
MVHTSGLDSNQSPSEATEPSSERGRLRACGTPAKEPFSSLKKMVPRVGLEPTLLSELDFESSASTNSTTGARSQASEHMSCAGGVPSLAGRFPQSGYV